MRIALIGPNACGKTTAVRRWCKKYPRLTGCLCDVRKVVAGGAEARDDFCWKSHPAECLAKYAGHDRVVFEGASSYGCRIAARTQAEFVIVVTVPAPAMLGMLEARAALVGKRFRGDYWDLARCGYEGSRRCVNYAGKNFAPGQWREFVVGSYADWAQIDVFFSGLYARLNNAMLRPGRPR